MTHVFVIRAFDVQKKCIYSDSPIGFTTKKEADLYCKIHSNQNDVIYWFDIVPMGKMNSRRLIKNNLK